MASVILSLVEPRFVLLSRSDRADAEATIYLAFLPGRSAAGERDNAGKVGGLRPCSPETLGAENPKGDRIRRT